MSQKPLIVRFFSLVSVFALIIIYLWLYLFPALESINMERREGKDLEVKIQDIRQERFSFSFSGQREALMLSGIDKELQERIPKIRGQAGWARLFKRTTEYIQRLAQRHAITPIEILDPAPPVSQPREGLKYREIRIGFTAEPGKGLNFINHLPWSDFHIAPQAISITPGPQAPRFTLDIWIYYTTGRKSVPVPQMPDLTIDGDSELLLEPVYENVPDRYSKRELPTPPGAGFPEKSKEK